MTDPIQAAAANLAKNNDANKPQGAASAASPLSAATGNVALTGNPEADLFNTIQNMGTALLTDLQAASSYANAPAQGGGIADPIAAPAMAAIIPLVQMIINGPPAAAGATAPAGSATPPGVITVVEKVRIIRMAIESQAFKSAVAPLILDEVQNIQNLASGLVQLLSGASIAGLVAIPKIP